jgi:ubiquinone/menaquinone biosynthesis C-methylase UbiE
MACYVHQRGICLFRKAEVIPVVHLDRHRKAQMIESILESFLGQAMRGYRVLDIGCGNGDISAYFARNNEQYGVDVSDKRRDKNRTFEFCIVNSEVLPFADGFFDVVISHHVIEHVDDQKLHLREIHRVLKSDGSAYLATPNRTSPLMKGHIGNDHVLRYREVEPLLTGAGFVCTDYSPRVVREPDRFYADWRIGRLIPGFLVRLLRFLIPSHIYILKPLKEA